MTDDTKERLQGLFWPVLERLGFPTALICVMMYFGWSAAEWVKVEVAKPLIASHMQYLQTTTALMERQEKVINEMQAATVQNSKLLREIHENALKDDRKRLVP